MKTKKQVISEYSDYRNLINAVISRIGMESVNDVINHGADCGFSGFIYYSDTHKFAITYRKQIVQLLEESAGSMVKDIVNMVKSFEVFRNNPMDSEDKKVLYKYLRGGRPKQGAITNVMAWFALEEVCRWFEE